MNRHLSETLAVVATIDPATYNVGSATSDWISLSRIQRVLFVLQTGVLSATSTIDLKIQARAGTASPVDVPGATITQLTKSAGDNRIVVMEVSTPRIDSLAAGYDQIRAAVTVGGAAAPLSLVALAGIIGYYPAAHVDLADVAEIIQHT